MSEPADSEPPEGTERQPDEGASPDLAERASEPAELAAIADGEEEEPPAPVAAPADPGNGSTGLLVWGVMLLSLLAALWTRTLAPALPGVWVGLDHVITAVKLASALSSQLAAVCTSALVMAMLFATLKPPLPLGLRAFSVGVGALVVLAVMIASVTRLPLLSGMIVGLGGSLLVLSLAIYSARLLPLRAPSLVLGAVAIAGLLRLAAIGSALFVIKGGSEGWATSARALATVGLVVMAAGLAAAMLWLMSQPVRTGTKLVISPVVSLVAAVAVAGVLLVLAYRGAGGEAQGFTLLVARASARLLPHPQPYVPVMLRLAVQWLSWTTALMVLLRRPRTLLMSAAVAGALICDGAVEMPLATGALVVGMLALLHHPAVDMRGEMTARK